MAAVVDAILVAVPTEFPFCAAAVAAAAAAGTELAYAAPAPDIIDVRSALELYDGDGNIVG
jgi:hypothetical protein